MSMSAIAKNVLIVCTDFASAGTSTTASPASTVTGTAGTGTISNTTTPATSTTARVSDEPIITFSFYSSLEIL